MSEGGSHEGEGSRVRSLVTDFCHELEVERNASVHTVRAYARDLNAYVDWCMRQGIDSLGASHKELRAFLADLDKAHYERATINRHLSSLRGFFRWLRVAGVIDNDPASALQGPKQNKHLPHVIRPNDMVKLLSVHADARQNAATARQGANGAGDCAIRRYSSSCMRAACESRRRRDLSSMTLISRRGR